MSADTYRRWAISFDYGWCATHPDFDASWEGEEDGWVGNGLCITGYPSREALIEEIDALEEERASQCGLCGGSFDDERHVYLSGDCPTEYVK